MTTSVNITSTSTANKKMTKSITNINPQISNSALKTAAQLFTAISTNTFNGADRIVRVDVNEPYNPSSPTLEPTLQVGEFEENPSNYFSADITYNGDGSLYVIVDTENAFATIANNKINVYSTEQTFSGSVFASAGTSYASKSVEFMY